MPIATTARIALATSLLLTALSAADSGTAPADASSATISVTAATATSPQTVTVTGLEAADSASGADAAAPIDDHVIAGHTFAFQTGTVQVGANLATITLPEGFRYLQATDAQFVVANLWGNPPDSGILGLVLPPGGRLTEEDTWAVIVSASDDGHVKDEDAGKLNYDDMLKQMQDQARDENPAREKQGYDTVMVKGWAERPHYDAAAHKLYYAENIDFTSKDEKGNAHTGTTLNYFVRILGRKGYLMMNAVASPDQLSAVAAGSKVVLGHTEFTAGNRYEDFKEGYDKVAAYGIGGLIAGGALLGAAKLGLFAGLGKLLIFLIKPLLVGLFAVSAWIARVFGGKKKDRPQDQK
jgi:uncharacterized membrane-anchored protein